VKGCHDLKTRKMGDMILVDAHIEVDAKLTLQEGHDIGVNARLATT
jgi:divalent metal cation (Fe/Co/Zn/Cd) transporter